MYNVKLTGSKIFDSQIIMHSCTPKKYFSLAKEFQKHMSKDNCKHGFIDQGGKVKEGVKANGQTESIMLRIILMLHTKI